MSKVYVAYLDDGHGMETAGKRTPKFSDGTIMHENEFNDSVRRKLDTRFKKQGFIVVEVAPGNTDIPLSTRTNTANKHYSDLCNKYGKANVVAVFISIHANAYKSEWGNWGGIETFYYKNGNTESSNGKKFASCVQKRLVQGTPLTDRGAKGENFHVLRETAMPSVLCECAFMDNLKEARLLQSDAYRVECADEIFLGTLDYLGLKPSSENTGNSSNGSLEHKDCHYKDLYEGLLKEVNGIKSTVDKVVSNSKK